MNDIKNIDFFFGSDADINSILTYDFSKKNATILSNI